MAREYDIAAASGTCRGCGRELAPGEQFVAVLIDADAQFRRDDFCVACWDGRQDEPHRAFSVWHSRVPLPNDPEKPVVNTQVIVDLFNKLEGHAEPFKVNFRFVLALMLMRKKLLAHEGSATDEAGRDIWKMRFRHDQTEVAVIHPELDEEQIAEVSASLGAIFEEPT